MYAGTFLLPLYYQQLHGESVLHAASPRSPSPTARTAGARQRGSNRSVDEADRDM
jgi:hypothetical protein